MGECIGREVVENMRHEHVHVWQLHECILPFDVSYCANRIRRLLAD